MDNHNVSVILWLMKLRLTTYKKGSSDAIVFFATELQIAFGYRLTDEQIRMYVALYRVLESFHFSDDEFVAKLGPNNNWLGFMPDYILAMLRRVKIQHLDLLFRPRYGEDATRILNPIAAFLPTPEMEALTLPPVPRSPYFMTRTSKDWFQFLFKLRDSGKINMVPGGRGHMHTQDYEKTSDAQLAEKFHLPREEAQEIVHLWMNGIKTLESFLSSPTTGASGSGAGGSGAGAGAGGSGAGGSGAGGSGAGGSGAGAGAGSGSKRPKTAYDNECTIM